MLDRQTDGPTDRQWPKESHSMRLKTCHCQAYHVLQKPTWFLLHLALICKKIGSGIGPLSEQTFERLLSRWRGHARYRIIGNISSLGYGQSPRVPKNVALTHTKFLETCLFCWALSKFWGQRIFYCGTKEHFLGHLICNRQLKVCVIKSLWGE